MCELAPGEQRDWCSCSATSRTRRRTSGNPLAWSTRNRHERCWPGSPPASKWMWLWQHCATYWDGMLAAYTVDSGDERVDRMVNIWNPYQCMVTFNMSRSASYFESGIGSEAWDSAIPTRISSASSTWCRSGPENASSTSRQPSSLTGAPITSISRSPSERKSTRSAAGFNDDPSVADRRGGCVHQRDPVTRQSLREDVPFDNDPEDSGTLFEHLKRSFHHPCCTTAVPMVFRSSVARIGTIA